MVYRARITNIIDLVEDYINIDNFTQVRDTKDLYIEVKSEELAEIIESLNKCKEQELEIKSRLNDFVSNNINF